MTLLQLLNCIFIYSVILSAALTLILMFPPFLCESVILVYFSAFLWETFIRDRVMKSQIDHVQKKAVLITGCDSGFGLQCAQTLQQDGFYVFAGCLSTESHGAELLKTLERVTVVEIDVTNEESIKNTLNVVQSELTKNDIEFWSLINNAGVYLYGPLELVPTDKVKNCFEVNVFGYMNVTKAFLPLLRRSKGRIVNMSSSLGLFTPPGMTGYSMSKHAIEAMSKGLHLELRRFGIKVIVIEPVCYNTGMQKNANSFKSLETFFADSTDEIKASYGPSIATKYNDHLKNMFKCHGRNDICEVSTTVREAVISRNPKRFYLCSGILDKIGMHLVVCLPLVRTEEVLTFCDKKLNGLVLFVRNIERNYF